MQLHGRMYFCKMPLREHPPINPGGMSLEHQCKNPADPHCAEGPEYGSRAEPKIAALW